MHLGKWPKLSASELNDIYEHIAQWESHLSDIESEEASD